MPTFSIQTPSGRTLDIEAADQDTAIKGAQEWESQNSRPLMDKLASFGRNVINNPPPTIAAIRDIVKGVPAAANELTFGNNPEAATQAAGTALKAAMLATPAAPGLRAGEGVLARAIPNKEPVPVPAIPAQPTMAPVTADALRTAREGNYRTAFGTGIGIAAPAMHEAYGSTLATIARDFDSSQAPSTFRILSEAATQYRPRSPDPLQAMTGAQPSARAPATGLEIESIQQRLRAIKPNQTHPQDAAAARQARAILDDALASMPDAAIVRGDAQAFRDAVAAGRGNTAAMYRMRALEGAEERGTLNAETASSGGNVENPGRQSFKSLVRPPLSGGPTPAQKMGFSVPEQQAIRDVAAPGLFRDTIRGIGKLAPTDPWRIIGNAELAKITGGATIPFTAASYGAKRLGDTLMQNSIQNAMSLTASRSPLYRARLAEYQRQMAAYAQAVREAQAAQAANGGILSGLDALQPGGLLGGKIAAPLLPQSPLPPNQL